jgi:hypothetical protein
MTIGAISNPLSPGSASSPARADKEMFSLPETRPGTAKAAAVPEMRLASLSDEMSNQGMRDFCANVFNEVVREINDLIPYVFLTDVELELEMALNGGKEAMAERLDNVTERINMLINHCSGFLPQSAMDDLRSMRDLVDRLRGALGIEMQEQGGFSLPRPDAGLAKRILGEIWNVAQRLAPLLGGGPANRPAY